MRKSIAGASAPDKNLLLALDALARSWQLPPPTWTKRAEGHFELNTPYGVLTVRRLVGWTVERNAVPLCWFHPEERLIFDKLEHAKISALAHARDFGDERFGDGTRWDKSGVN